jgi:hypothetical protein
MAAWLGWFEPKYLHEKLRLHEAGAEKETETMSYEGKKDYPNSGILFKEPTKREARDRDYKGSADITCSCGRRTQHWLSAWIKEGRKGKFLTLAFKPKEPNGQPQRPADINLDDF